MAPVLRSSSAPEEELTLPPAPVSWTRNPSADAAVEHWQEEREQESSADAAALAPPSSREGSEEEQQASPESWTPNSPATDTVWSAYYRARPTVTLDRARKMPHVLKRGKGEGR